MFQKTTLSDFLRLIELEQISVLFIKEQGCKFCEAAENEMKKITETLPAVKFFEVLINDEPTVPTKLGLIGVPAFLKIDRAGRKKLKIGFAWIKRITHGFTNKC